MAISKYFETARKVLGIFIYFSKVSNQAQILIGVTFDKHDDYTDRYARYTMYYLADSFYSNKLVEYRIIIEMMKDLHTNMASINFF